MTDLDSLLRAADPAAGLTPPEPGPPPFGLSVRAGSDQSPVDRLTPGPRLRPTPRPPAGRGRHWLPVAATATAVVAVIVAAGVGFGARDGGGPSGGGAASTAPDLPTVRSGGPIPTETPSLLPTPPDPTSYPTATAPAVATAGPDREAALRVLARLRAAVPARYGKPTGTLPIGQNGAPQPAQAVQAARFPTRPEAGMVWDVSQVVTLGRGVGGVSATVFHDVPDWSSDPCTVFARLDWYVVGCTAMQTAAGVPVGILTSVGARYAFHRYADGTAVVVSAGVGAGWGDQPQLTALPLSDLELSRLATDPAFVS
jgi:hypothetical protein